MNYSKLNINYKLIICELLFLIVLRFLLISIPHESQDIIYYINLNFHYLFACLSWINYRQSKVNKTLVLILSIWYTPYVIIVLFYIFTSNIFSLTTVYIIYHIAYIYIVVYQLFITFYLFFLSLSPARGNKNHLIWSISCTMVISTIIYAPIFISGEFVNELRPLFNHSYYINLLNFSLLAVFWHQYTRTKLLFSEYLSSIVSVYTVIIGIEILHTFSIPDNLIFVLFVQYFNFVLYLILSVLWIIRIKYLNRPESQENENYIENYYMLQGFVEKPRKGILISFYSSMNKSAVVTGIVVMIFLGVYLFSFDSFQIFVKMNILVLILSVLISAVLAIITWHKRWYDAMGFFFKKQSTNKSGR